MLRVFFPPRLLNQLLAFFSPSLPKPLPPGYARVASAAYPVTVALTRPVQFMAFYFFR